LNKAEIDALLMRAHGYVETDHPKRFSQLTEIIHEKLNIRFPETTASYNKSVNCLLSQFGSTGIISGSSGNSTGRFVTNSGTVCEDNDILLTAVAYIILPNGSIFPNGYDAQVLTIGVDTQERVKAGGQIGFSPPVFVGLQGTVAELSGGIATGIITKATTENSYFCDPDDFGDGYRTETSLSARNSVLGDGIVNYGITLLIGCKD
ncbi:MAG: hypothetical protein WBA17_10220, partial [Saprospiraceae bacterium]